MIASEKPTTLLNVTPWVFLRVLNCTNVTKSRKASYIFEMERENPGSSFVSFLQQQYQGLLQ